MIRSFVSRNSTKQFIMGFQFFVLTSTEFISSHLLVCSCSSDELVRALQWVDCWSIDLRLRTRSGDADFELTDAEADHRGREPIAREGQLSGRAEICN